MPETDLLTIQIPNFCKNCGVKLKKYRCKTTFFIQCICFNCGFYWSNSEAYHLLPDSFETMLIRNPRMIQNIISNGEPVIDGVEG